MEYAYIQQVVSRGSFSTRANENIPHVRGQYNNGGKQNNSYHLKLLLRAPLRLRSVISLSISPFYSLSSRDINIAFGSYSSFRSPFPPGQDLLQIDPPV